MLELLTRDDPPVIVLRHVRGPHCTAPDYDVVVEVAHGEALVQEGNPGGLFAPGVQWERTFRYHPRCDERGPFLAVVHIGPYSARGAIQAMPCLRTAQEIAVFQRGCVRSWNGPANRENRELVVEGRFDSATLFRTSDEICGLQLISIQTGRWLLAFRRARGHWVIERTGRSDRSSGDGLHDAVPVEVRLDGRLRLG
jgi:hypothetical protein